MTPEKLKELEEDLKAKRKQHKDIRNQEAALAKEIEAEAAELDRLKRAQRIKVTDHAVVRYLEREMQIDTALIRQQLLTQRLIGLVEALGGTGKYPVEGGRVVMEDYTIVTYISDEQDAKKD